MKNKVHNAVVEMADTSILGETKDKLEETISQHNSSRLDLEGGDDPPPEEGGEAPPMEEMEDPIAKISAFLTQIPPNWELAEAHGKANGVVNSSETQVDFENPDSYCQCCQLPIPSEQHLYPICVDNTQLGDLGPGFPLFFIFMKYLCIYLLWLSLIFFLPMAILIYSALTELQQNLAPYDSEFALFSFGALIHHTGEVGYENLDVTKRQEYINIYGMIYLISVLFSALFFAYIKTKIWQNINELDQAAFTPSDFCIMGQNIGFEAGAGPKEIEEGIKAFLNDNFEGLGEKVVYVNPAYKIGEFYKVSTRYTELTKLNTILNAYKEKHELSDEQMQEYADMGETAPEDYPRINTSCGGKCGARPVTMTEVKEELTEVEEKIAAFEKQATDDADPEEQREKFTGIVFIVFQNPQDCLRVTANNNWFPMTKFIVRTFFPCCAPDTWRFVFERAPEPSDIYWENMGVTTL